MIIDADKVLPNSELSCDICIVGAGAAGITLAMELNKSELDIILIEAGKADSSGKSLKLYQGEVIDGQRHLPADQARYRQLGGTTSMWGGRCIPYDTLDFETRSYVANSGWPLTRHELDPFYKRAHVYCQCGDYNYNVRESLPDGMTSMISGFEDGQIVSSTIERWSPPTHFGKTYKQHLKLAKNIRVYLKAVVTDIECEDSEKTVSGLTIKTLAGHDHRVKAKHFVLTGGGLEVTRLLLSSNKIHKNGIGNHSGWLGKCYMPHIHGSIANVSFKLNQHIIFGYEQDAQGIYCRRRLCLSEAAQKQLKVLNMYFLLDRPLIGDPKHGNALLSLAFIAKQLRRKGVKQDIGSGKYGMYWAHIKNVISGSAGLAYVLPQFSRKRFLQKRRIPSLIQKPNSNNFSLYFQAEQAPSVESQVLLTDKKDIYGNPQLKIDFKISELDVDSVYESHKLIQKELARQSCGTLTFNSDNPKEDIRNCSAVMGHHIGTTRMAVDKSKGVVDENCLVHNLNNLYVASSSVFPTSSQANPVLTIVALAIRLADHLKTK